jgi:arylsulfatase
MYRNEKKVSTKGYCSDIFTTEAIGFVRNNKKKPFFAYLAFNAPHTPLQVPEQYSSISKDLTLANFKNNMNKMNPVMNNKDLEDAKKVYGMMSNIVENIGRLIKELENLDLMKNTAIIFLSDNGPQQNRYVMGLRGRKGMVYQGGIKSPCIIHYPGIFPENKEISTTVAHIDLLPTILDLCNIKKGGNNLIDSLSMVPLLKDNDGDFSNRTLFFEWGRGFPIPYKNFAAMKGHFKLVGQTYEPNSLDGFELFDLITDPEESENIINKNSAIALILKKEIEEWYYLTTRHPNNRNVHLAFMGTKH